MIALDEYEALRRPPEQPVVMYQDWRSLTFLHFPCDPATIQATLPPGLAVDVYPGPDGRPAAWVGLIPFRMKNVRPRFMPPLPGLSAFPETNVRTYVHREGRLPGVWFYSLDAANAVACYVARKTFGLPYYFAEMSVQENPDEIVYESERKRLGPELQTLVHPGEALPPAEPGTLEYFLIERYLLYSVRKGHLLAGRVHHQPYPLRKVEVEALSESLVNAAGIAPRPYTHQVFSPGVDVKIHGLQAVV